MFTCHEHQLVLTRDWRETVSHHVGHPSSLYPESLGRREFAPKREPRPRKVQLTLPPAVRLVAKLLRCDEFAMLPRCERAMAKTPPPRVTRDRAPFRPVLRTNL